jgi:peptide/nickel transport system substrate-binding protein
VKNIILKQFKIILLTAVFIFVTDCGKRDRNPDVLRFAMSADIRGFDPAFATDIRTGKMMTLVYDNLVQFGDNTEVIPGIAYKWNLDETGKIYYSRSH